MNQKVIVLLFVLLSVTVCVSAQKKPNGQELKIQTSAQCDQCKERIEKALAYEKGVKSSDLDLETKILTVWYSEKKTTPDKIRKAVADVGYDADQVAANPKAYAELPGCCKKPDDPNYRPH